MKIRPDTFAYWYLRLNGFLTTVNCVVHPETGSDQRTDVDVLGVRFPYRAELVVNPMQDDPIHLLSHDRPVVLIAKVKSGLCALNGPWTNEGNQNMQRVLRVIGISPIDREAQIARDLYAAGRSDQQEALISLACFGEQISDSITARLPSVPQITWAHVAAVVFERFMTYSRQKVSHPQWSADGLNLWNTAFKCESALEFRAAISF